MVIRIVSVIGYECNIGIVISYTRQAENNHNPCFRIQQYPNAAVILF